MIGTTATADRRRRRAERGARHDPRGARSSRRAAGDGRRRRRGGGHRDDVPRPRARARRRRRLRRRDPHQPDPRAPRAPRVVGGVPRRQAVAVRAAGRVAGRTRREAPGRRSAIVNADDPSAGRVHRRRPGGRRAGPHLRHGPVGRRPRDPRSRRTRGRLRVAYDAPSGAATLELRLAGRFNVHNALAVVALGEASASIRPRSATGSRRCRSCPGGWSGSTLGQPFGVIVDFAHSPASLADGARPAGAGRGGARRRAHRRLRVGRRAGHGQAAADGPDRRRALPARGRDRRGPARRGPAGRSSTRSRAAPRRPARGAATTCWSSPTGARRSTRPSSAPRPGDIVLLAGKGHERSIIGPDGPIPWDERAEAEAALRRGLGYALTAGGPRRGTPRYPSAMATRRPAPRPSEAGEARRPSPPPSGGAVRGRDAGRGAPVRRRRAQPRRRQAAADLDGASRRTARSASIVEHHPGADLDAGRPRRSTSRSRPHTGQRRATGEPYVTHPIASAQILADLGIDPIADRGRAPPRRPRGHRVQPDRRRGALRRRGRPARRRRHEAVPLQHPQPRAAAGREHPQDAAGDGPGHPGRPHQARRPPPQHAHAVRPAVGEAAAHRPPDDGDLRAAGRAARDLADEVGARGPRVQGARARALPRAGQAARHAAQGPRDATSSAPSPSCGPSLEAAGIEADIEGRPKHIYSIWKKMQRKGAEFGEIYDVYAIRLLVDEVRDCYAALGIVHSHLAARSPASSTTTSRSPRTTSTSRSTPRSSRSTASRSRSRSGPTRCTRCPRSASPPTGATRKAPSPTASTTPSSPGCASSWTGSATSPSRTRPSSSRASSSTSSRTRSSCSRPKGDIKDLPAGATPLDFAYRIHTDVGHRTIGAKVNNRLVPLDYRLKNGDIVEIVTTKGEHGPSRDWLNVVRTSHAREKIRQWFKRKDRDENIVHGRESLERELRRLARTSIAAVGPGPDRRGRQPVQLRVGRRLLRGHRLRRGRRPVGGHALGRRRRRPEHAADRRPAAAARADRRRPGQGRRRPARPVRQVLPPDPGRPDRRVHHPRQGRDGPPPDAARRSSTSARSAGSSRSSGRPRRPQTYPIAIRVEAYDRTGLLSDITQVVAENKVNIVAAARRRHAGPHGRRHRHAPGPLGLAAGPGHEPDRDPQGRHQRPARPRLTRPRPTRAR